MPKLSFSAPHVLYFGYKNFQHLRNRVIANSKMRLSILLSLVIIVLAVTKPNTVYCRNYPSKVKAIVEEPIMKEKYSDVFRVLIDGKVHTMSSGPSEKGPGHWYIQCFSSLLLFNIIGQLYFLLFWEDDRSDLYMNYMYNVNFCLYDINKKNIKIYVFMYIFFWSYKGIQITASLKH